MVTFHEKNTKRFIYFTAFHESIGNGHKIMIHDKLELNSDIKSSFTRNTEPFIDFPIFNVSIATDNGHKITILVRFKTNYELGY